MIVAEEHQRLGGCQQRGQAMAAHHPVPMISWPSKISLRKWDAESADGEIRAEFDAIVSKVRGLLNR